MKKAAKKVPVPVVSPLKYYSASQARRDYQDIELMYEQGCPKIMTPEIRDKLRAVVCQKLADSVA